MKPNLRFYFSFAIFLISFIIYIITAAPDVTFTDSGELAGVCTTLGIAHPTGYPLFTLLGHLWTLIPLPFTKIYSLNLFAGFLTALSSVVFFLWIGMLLNYLSKKKEIHTEPVQKKKNLTKKKTIFSISIFDEKQILLISLCSAFIYSFAQTVWAQGTSIEVYSLQILIINLVLLTLIKAVTTEPWGNKYYYLTAFLIGCGFSNHMSTIMLLPAVIFIFIKLPGEKPTLSKKHLKLLAFLIIPFLIGISFYIYMPVRSASFPDFNWGWVHRGWDKFLYHTQGKQFQEWMGFTKIFKSMFGSSDVPLSVVMEQVSEIWNKNFTIFIKIFPQQFGWIGLVPLFAGFYFVYKFSRTFFWFFIILIVSCLGFAFNYPIHDIDSYFLTAFIGFFVFTTIGIAGIFSKYQKFLAIIFIIPVLSLFINYDTNNDSDNYLVPEYTRLVTQNLKPGAIVFSSQWDFWVSALWYKQLVEKYRPDIVIIDKELLRRTWYLEHLKRWYPETIPLCNEAITLFNKQLELFESDKPYNPEEIQKRFIEMINCWIDKFYGKRPIYITREIYLNDTGTEVDTEIGEKYLKIPDGFALRLELENKPYTVSVDNINIDKFVKSIRTNSGHLVDGIKNIALFYLLEMTGNYANRTGQKETAKKAFELGVKIDPTNENIRNVLNNLETR